MTETREEKLARLRKAAEERRRLVADPARTKAVIPPDKWEAPLGFDAEGRPLPPPPAWLRTRRKSGC